MIIKAYLVINNRGSLRVVVNRPALNNTEIAVQLNINIPDVFFDRLMPTINIQIPKESIINTNIDSVDGIS